LATVSFGVAFLGNITGRGVWAPSTISAQQGQMARFAHEYWAKPIAVNDLGYVSYRSPGYVLDLYGLGNSEAMEIRTGNPPAGWADPLVQAADVDLIMIYPRWFRGGLGPDWAPLGTLKLKGPAGYVAFSGVKFYAARQQEAPEILDALQRFVPTLPPTAVFEFEVDLAGDENG